MTSETVQPYPHYFRQLPPGCTHIDVYRVLELFGVTSPALAHAVKKLLCAGARGAKDQGQGIAEAIATLQRWQQMREEEQPAPDLREAVAEMREIRGKYCECGAREYSACPGQWEPGCDLCANEAHALPAPPEAALALREAMQPAPAAATEGADLPTDCTGDPSCCPENEGYGCCKPNPQTPEDAERAAYEARWKDAPEWAEFRSEHADGSVFWLPYTPADISPGWKCEPRPVQGVGP